MFEKGFYLTHCSILKYSDFPFYVKIKFSAKLKAGHMQVRVFHAKQNGIPCVTNIESDYQRYSQTGL